MTIKNLPESKNIIKLLFLSFLVLTLLFSNTATASDIEIILNSLKIQQGSIIKVTLKSETRNLKAENYQAKFAGNNFSFYKNNSLLETTIAASYWSKAGIHNLKIKENQKYIYHKNIRISKVNFTESWINVSEDKEKLVSSDKKDEKLQKRLEKDREKVARARSKSSSQKLYENNFIWPISGPITTEFGAARYVNAKLQSRHSGIDIAAKKGAPVKASNNGKIVLAAELKITGNTVIIDHGHNIFSTYAHLSQLNVQKNELVSKGEKIGEIGSTGFSTGPHLHWTMKVANVFVNPKVFTK